MAAHLFSAGKASKIAAPPTITKIVGNKADLMVSVLPIRRPRDEVLENLPALSRNQWRAHSQFKPPGRRFKLNKRGQPFIRTHNETLSVAAMCVSNPDCSPVGINRRDGAPTPTGFRDCQPLAAQVCSLQAVRSPFGFETPVLSPLPRDLRRRFPISRLSCAL